MSTLLTPVVIPAALTNALISNVKANNDKGAVNKIDTFVRNLDEELVFDYANNPSKLVKDLFKLTPQTLTATSVNDMIDKMVRIGRVIAARENINRAVGDVARQEAFAKYYVALAEEDGMITTDEQKNIDAAKADAAKAAGYPSVEAYLAAEARKAKNVKVADPVNVEAYLAAEAREMRESAPAKVVISQSAPAKVVISRSIFNK